MPVAMVIVLLTITFQPAHGMPQKPNTEAAPDSKQAAESQEHSNPQLPPSVIKTAVTQEDATADDQGRANSNNQKSNSEARLVTFTGWLVGVGVLQAVILLLTVIAFWKQNSAHRRSERAWLAVNIKKKPGGHQEVDGGLVIMGCGFVWQVTNCGKTPAFVTRIGARFHSAQKLSLLPAEPDVRISGLQQPTEEYPHGLGIAPGESVERYTMCEEPRPFGENTRNASWVAYGIVEYRTVFSKKWIHRTRFCYGWSPEQPERFVRSPIPEGYTEQT